MIISLTCALLSGVTIVLSRSVNAYLSDKVGPYLGTFFNYFTGLLASLIIFLLIGLPYVSSIDIQTMNPIVFFGGVIGVLNILILNIIVLKVSPVVLTLLTFISQLLCGMILDCFIQDLFSIQKLVGCIIVIVGLIIYQCND